MKLPRMLPKTNMVRAPDTEERSDFEIYLFWFSAGSANPMQCREK